MDGLETYAANLPNTCEQQEAATSVVIKDHQSLETPLLGSETSSFGPWMIAKRRQRPKKASVNQPICGQSLSSSQDHGQGSRFSMLDPAQETDPEVQVKVDYPQKREVKNQTVVTRIRNATGGKNPQNGVRNQNPKSSSKALVLAKGKQMEVSPSKTSKITKDVKVAEISSVPKQPHQDEQLVFQMMELIQAQIREHGTPLLPGTQVFRPGTEELEFLQKKSALPPDSNPTNPEPSRSDQPMDLSDSAIGHLGNLASQALPPSHNSL
ncbi:hypothetical protein SESBI_27815 [Sesbania bispinosa]|nr:hypothetical protein SESBI_27815 [Sesbania bispinosa]